MVRSLLTKLKGDISSADSNYLNLFTAPVGSLESYNQVSSLLKTISNCNNCYIKKFCSKYPSLKDFERKMGCDDLQELWKGELRKYSNPVSYALLDELARIDVKSRILELSDGANDLTVSGNMIKLMQIKSRYIELILKYYRPKKETHIHEFKFDDKSIAVNKGAYDEGSPLVEVDVPETAARVKSDDVEQITESVGVSISVDKPLFGPDSNPDNLGVLGETKLSSDNLEVKDDERQV